MPVQTDWGALAVFLEQSAKSFDWMFTARARSMNLII